MTVHPVDAHGRVLPEPGWPADRAAPGELELVRRFCNSINRENGADRFATGAGFDDWLVAEGHDPTGPTGDDLASIATVRDALHEIIVANRQGHAGPDRWRVIADVLTDTAYVVRATAGSVTLVATSRSPTLAFLGELVLRCIRARDTGTFGRLRSCAHCRWIVFDRSKNQSGRWCSMAACGGRQNARAYRRRQR